MLRSVGSTAPRAACHFGPRLDELVAEVDERGPLARRCGRRRRGRGPVRPPPSGGRRVTDRRVGVVDEEARPLHHVAVGVDDPARVLLVTVTAVTPVQW